MGTSRRYSNPRDFLKQNGIFPEGPFKPGTPQYALKTARVAARLDAAIDASGRSARQVALAAGIDPGTLSRLLSGQSIPDLATLDALETALGATLWTDPTDGTP